MNLKNKTDQERAEYYKNKCFKYQERIGFMKGKLTIKTCGLWFAAGVIADNNLIPGKNQEDVYEMLKLIGEDEQKKRARRVCKQKEQEKISKQP